MSMIPAGNLAIISALAVCLSGSAARGQCITQGQNAAIYVADGATVRMFSDRTVPAGAPILMNLAPQAVFASDPPMCVAYGKAAAPPVTVPALNGRVRESIEGTACRSDGVGCPQDSKRRLWVLTRSGKIYREDDTDGITPTSINGQPAMTINTIAMPGAASRINAGADGSIWTTGTDAVPGGHSIYKWMGTDWVKLSRNGINAGVSPSGSAWVIDSESTLHRFDGVGWNRVAVGGARVMDVGWNAATDLPVYYIDTASPAAPGTPARYQLVKWVGLQSPGNSLTKATNPDSFPSHAFLISATGNMWSLNGTQVTARVPQAPAGSEPIHLISTLLTEDGGFSH